MGFTLERGRPVAQGCEAGLDEVKNSSGVQHAMYETSASSNPVMVVSNYLEAALVALLSLAAAKAPVAAFSMR